MKKVFLILPALLLGAVPLSAQRVMDKLDRGVIAVKATTGNFVSWRVLGEDADNVKFNVYRDGTKLNSEPLTVSNFQDNSGSTTSKYTVKTVVDGVEKETSKAGINFGKEYLEIKVAPVPSNADGSDISSHYEPNDATVADLDGDGQMEILIKMRNNTFHHSGYAQESTDYDIIQVYKLDGTLMWWIDCGRNMVDFQSNEINIAAYDWDGDGKAECVMRAADGTTIHMADGSKQVIGDPNVDTLPDARNNGMTEKFTHSGAEYLLYLNGETGKPYQVMTYPLARLEPGETDLNKAWGDGYGHRSSKHFFGAPYLDGRKPSIFLARGIYTRHKMVAFDVNPTTHELVERWRWVCNQSGSAWFGNGYHNYCVGDVDWDGRDEIVFGSMVIDDNGRGLSTTGLGHGDSQHLGDFNPYIYGQEFVACNEDRPSNNYRDATTSKIYYRATGNADDGRAIAGNFSNEYPGAQFITSHDSGTLISCVANGHIAGAGPTNDVAQNFRIYWDGDLLDETFNYSSGKNTAGAIYKFRHGNIHTFTGTATNNDTKGTPCFQGDILGDWREEIILRSSDNKSFRIYSTTIPTEHRIYTLLHDPQYRNAMVWQMNGYNQTPHTSFFLGELEGITVAPPSPTMNNRTELAAGGSLTSTSNGKDVVFAATGNASASIAAGVSPALFVDNTPSWVQGNDNNDNITTTYYTHTLTGGSFGGNTKLVKLGAGTLVLPNAAQNHSGATEIWAGTVSFDGSMPNSHVWINRFGKLQSNGGNFAKGIEMNYGAELIVGADDKAGSVTTGELKLGFGSRVCLDLFADNKADNINATTLTIEKKDWQHGPQYSTPVLAFTIHNAAGQTAVAEGDYVLGTIGTVKGDLNDIVVEGLNGHKGTLSVKNGQLVLSIAGSRAATEIVWSGASGTSWDLNETSNFTIRATGEPTVFVAGDKVIFDDSAASTDINISETLYPAEVIFNNSEKDFTITGAGFEGTVNIEKKGTGRVKLNNTSNFTGKITINNGVLEVSSLGANEGTETGALGHYNNEIAINGGGALAVNFTGKMSHPMVVSEGGIEVAAGKTLTIVGGAVTGNGTFIKSGAGQINFISASDINICRIDEGKIYDEGDTHCVGKNIVFNGNKVEFIYNNSAYSYSKNYQNYDVPEGKSGKLTLDGRCDYYGKLTGKGDFEVFAPWTRNYMHGDWSEFEGTLTASKETNPNNTVNKYGADFLYSGSALPKATLNISSGTAFNCNPGGNGIHIGNITGLGTLGGSGNFYVGGNGKNCTFDGIFAAIGVIKEGAGRLSITKDQPNVVAVHAFEGELMIKGTTIDAAFTGTGAMTVKSTLMGNGTVKNSKVTFNAGSVLNPTHTTKALKTERRTMRFTGEVIMDPASSLVFDIVAADKHSKLLCEGKATLTPKATVNFNGYSPKLGDEFILWEAPNNTVKPNVQCPALPAGLFWDMSKVTAQKGLVIVSDHSGIEDIAADTEVRCMVVSVDGIILIDTVTTAGNVKNICNDLGAGTYIVRTTANGIDNVEKITVR